MSFIESIRVWVAPSDLALWIADAFLLDLKREIFRDQLLVFLQQICGAKSATRNVNLLHARYESVVFRLKLFLTCQFRVDVNSFKSARTEHGNDGFNKELEKFYAALKEMLQLLDQMKQLGVFDNSHQGENG